MAQFQGSLNPGKCLVEGCSHDRAQGMRMPSPHGNFVSCGWPIYGLCRDHLDDAAVLFLRLSRYGLITGDIQTDADNLISEVEGI